MSSRPSNSLTIKKGLQTAMLGVCLLGTCIGGSVSGEERDFDEILDQMFQSLPPVSDLSHDKAWQGRIDRKVDPSLLRFWEKTQGKAWQEIAERAFELGIPYEAGFVAISLTAQPGGDIERLMTELKARGGLVTANLDDVVYARLPVRHIEYLSDIQGLRFVAPQPQFYPPALKESAKGVSDGVEATQVRRLHEAGIKGKGVKIGVLDFGFRRYDELRRAGEVPPPKAQRAFNQSQRLDADSISGTVTAEIIHDMAPEAELYLAAVDGTFDQIVQAVEWLVQQGVDIINFPGANIVGPLNGRDPFDRLVDKVASEYGILWVNAAGNSGHNHWLGKTEDRNRNELIDVSGNSADTILIKSAGQKMVVVVNWDDWGDDPQYPAASQNIDAYLARYDQNRAKFELVAKSTNPQDGHGRPLEGIGIKTASGQIYALILKAVRVDRPVNIHAFILGAAQIQPLVPEGSITIPATSPEALAVAAVNPQTDQLEPFSSQGPTDDGRLKPDVSAPDRVLSLSAGQGNQAGGVMSTGVGSAHVSGYAALFKQMEPGLKAEDLRQKVIQYIRKIGSESLPNNQYGHGFIDASEVPIAGQTPEPSPGQGSREGRRILDSIREMLNGSDIGK